MPKKLPSKSIRYGFTKKGFSFIEVMLAAFLLVMGVLTAVTLLTKGLSDSLDSRYQMSGTLLAQEGVELVRNIRDNNWAASLPTFANLPTANADHCKIDTSTTNLLDAACSVTTDTDKTLYLSSSTKLYSTVQSGSRTKFQRKIQIIYTPPPAANATQATVIGMTIWGNSFPPSIATCDSARKCAYAVLTLTNWGAL